MPTNPTVNWLRRIALLILFSAATASAVSAQTPPGAASNLEAILIPGTTVWITDSAGREYKTRIVEVSGGVVTASAGEDIRRFRTGEVMQVEVPDSDSLINGALLGAGVGVAAGLFICRLTEPWEVCFDNVGPLTAFGAIGAGAGIGIDALIRGRRTIYVAPGRTRLEALPVFIKGGGGLQVSVRF